MQAGRLQPALDLPAREADPLQLRMADDAVLPPREPGNEATQLVRSTFATYAVGFVDLARHDASLRSRALRRCALCNGS